MQNPNAHTWSFKTVLQFIPYLYSVQATVLAAVVVGLLRAQLHTLAQLHNIHTSYTVLHINHQVLFRNIRSSCSYLCIDAHNSFAVDVDRQRGHKGKGRRNCFHNETHTCTAARPLRARVAADALGWVEIDCNRGVCKETALLSEVNN